ncbi:MAG: hypothetical protein GY859_18145 [Desulfobacterales bacterium]|nr:hypothetical protein [Desulfobacterales bacterium]
MAELYGLRRVGADDARAPGALDKTVVLIHGLDDPGKVWMNLAPARPRSTSSPGAVSSRG